jgi:7-cyano-7-deazaguanine synthase in queuosine biosynthesis
MSEARVTVHGALGRPRHDLTIRVNGRDANFEIKSERIAASFNRNMDARLSDFIDIASCIFAADSSVSRGSKLRPGFGEAWRRRMSFRFAVRDPDFWSQHDIKSALLDAVQFMSDDVLDLTFERAENVPPVQPMFEFGPNANTFHADDVILFSGGLDSLAGAFERLSTAPGKIILLSHISANKRISYARNLVDCLKELFPNRILWVPVTAHLKGIEAKETTQRTRSLLFACLGFVTAKLSGARRLYFYENGIVSANLPIAAQVIGTMASRTTHPQTLHSLAALFNAITPGDIALANPYGTLTKAEVAKRLDDHGGADLIRKSVSCSHVRQQTTLHPHCGSCSQCLDRRFGILAAGLAAHDPIEGYEIDVLTDPRPTDDARILALDWTRHALRLAEMSDMEFLAAFGNELARLVAARPDLSSAEHARSIIAMHRTHGEGVKAALSAAISAHSAAIVAQSLDPTSLLRMVVTEKTSLPKPTTTVKIAAAQQNPLPPHEASLSRLRVSISGSARSARVIIDGLGEVSGMNATPAWALKPNYDTDRNAGIAPDAYRFMAGGEIAGKLGAAKPAVRQQIKRLREEFAEQFEAIEGVAPSEPILVQSRGSRDYRLDPDCEISNDPPNATQPA